MKPLLTSILTIVMLALAFAPSAHAQRYTDSERLTTTSGGGSGIGIEVRFGPSFTTDNFGATDLGDGFGGEFHGNWFISPNFAIFTGLTGIVFDANEDFTGRDNAITDLGYVAGVKFGGRFGRTRVGWQVHGAANYGEIKLYEEDTDNNIGETGHELGWEVGYAVTIALPNKWVLTPGMTYRSRRADLTVNGVREGVDLNYVTVGMGFSRTW